MTIRLTDKRLEWLRRLEAGPAYRSKNNVGYYCMQAGWTEWNYLDRSNGEPINAKEARDLFGEHWWEEIIANGERLTEAGRKIVEDRA